MATSTALVCACGTRIVGCGYVEAVGGASADGPRLCRSCAVDHGREVPGSIAPALAAPAQLQEEGRTAVLDHSHRLWPHIDAWSAELGLTGPDAMARASEPAQDEDGEVDGDDT
jgi:hypothetical protein